MRPRFCLGLGNVHFSEKKLYETIGAGARKVENLVRFLHNFDPHFPNIRRVWKINRKILQKYWKYWKYGSNNAWKQRITLSFYLKWYPET